MEEKKLKNSRQLERHFKGLANHNRLDILFLVQEQPGITVDGITQRLDRNFKTISDHTRKLVHAGLVNKKYAGHTVLHTLSPYGEKLFSLIKIFQKS